MNATVEIHEAVHGLGVSHPGILGGKPVCCGNRLPVPTLFEYLAESLTQDYYLETFPFIRRE